MLNTLYYSLPSTNQKRVKRYGSTSILLLIAYISIYTYAINNKNQPSLNFILTVFAGLGILLAVFFAVALFTLFIGEKESGTKNNNLGLILAILTFFMPIIPLLCLAYAGHRKNNMIFRVVAGVITSLHTLLFNSVLLTAFDPAILMDAELMPFYILTFISFLLILARFIKYLPLTYLEKIYKFLNLDK